LDEDIVFGYRHRHRHRLANVQLIIIAVMMPVAFILLAVAILVAGTQLIGIFGLILLDIIVVAAAFIGLTITTTSRGYTL
jgi:hypothetical protein